jgi:hypothetical protein
LQRYALGDKEDRREDDGEAPGGSAGQAAKTRPFQAGENQQKPDQEGKRGTGEQEQRREQAGDEDRGGRDPRSELTFQATSARFAASSCSLVRPKRRSRLR